MGISDSKRLPFAHFDDVRRGQPITAAEFNKTREAVRRLYRGVRPFRQVSGAGAPGQAVGAGVDMVVIADWLTNDASDVVLVRKVTRIGPASWEVDQENDTRAYTWPPMVKADFDPLYLFTLGTLDSTATVLPAFTIGELTFVLNLPKISLLEIQPSELPWSDGLPR